MTTLEGQSTYCTYIGYIQTFPRVRRVSGMKGRSRGPEGLPEGPDVTLQPGQNVSPLSLEVSVGLIASPLGRDDTTRYNVYMCRVLLPWGCYKPPHAAKKGRYSSGRGREGGSDGRSKQLSRSLFCEIGTHACRKAVGEAQRPVKSVMSLCLQCLTASTRWRVVGL